MDYQNLLLERDEGLVLVKLNRPKSLNALNKKLLQELEKIMLSLNREEECKVIIITGSGKKAFAAGADINEMKDLKPIEAQEFSLYGQRIFSLIENSSKAVIAAINGYALGGGNELALACDLRIASENAFFGQPEVGLGIIPGFGGTQRLVKIIGLGKAKELLLTGETIDAQTALKIGLVNHVVTAGTLLTKAKELAKKIAAQAPLSIGLTKKAVNHALVGNLQNGLAYEANSFAICFSTEDQKRGMKSFLQKEKVEFKGK